MLDIGTFSSLSGSFVVVEGGIESQHFLVSAQHSSPSRRSYHFFFNMMMMIKGSGAYLTKLVCFTAHFPKSFKVFFFGTIAVDAFLLSLHTLRVAPAFILYPFWNAETTNISFVLKADLLRLRTFHSTILRLLAGSEFSL